MLADQDAPSLTALTFAAAVARAAGNTEEERRLIDQALAVDEADDPDVRLEVIDFISTSGRAAEAVELLEQRLKEAADDDFAVRPVRYGDRTSRRYSQRRSNRRPGARCGAPVRRPHGPRCAQGRRQRRPGRYRARRGGPGAGDRDLAD